VRCENLCLADGSVLPMHGSANAAQTFSALDARLGPDPAP